MNLFAIIGDWIGATVGPVDTPARPSLHDNTKASEASFDKTVNIQRDVSQQIVRVSIGSWRVVAASSTRRIIEVRKQRTKGRDCIAIQIELTKPLSMSPTSTVWEVYDRSGRLQSILQSTDDSCLWIETRCGSTNNSQNQPPITSSEASGSFAIPTWRTNSVTT